MSTRHGQKRDEGMALLLCVIFLLGMGLTLAYTTTRIANNQRHVDAHIEFENCYEGLESGFAAVKLELSREGMSGVPAADQDGFVGVDPTFDVAIANPQFDTSPVNPLAFTSMPNTQYFAYAIDWANDGIDDTGDGLVDTGPEADGYYALYSFARSVRGGDVIARRGAESIVHAENVNIWSNAIFAGSGQNGNLINGNVSVHGSVHLLGDANSSGGVSFSAMAMSGTSFIGNNYAGLSADLLQRIPPAPVKNIGGEIVETLNATLRVKHGLMGLSGNSKAGLPNVNGNGVKETLDGVYVSDGWTGTSIDGSGNPTSVYSDNGYNESYDLGNAVPFPNFSDDAGLDFLSYYLTEDPPGVGLHAVHSGPMTINAGESYYWNATTGVEVINGTPGDGTMPLASTLDPNEFYVWFDECTNVMNANGRIPVAGDITIDRGTGNDKTIYYTGKATFMAQDNTGPSSARDIFIHVNLIARNADGTAANSFPQANLLGFMAENDLVIGDTAQLSLMGGFYAQNTVRANRQSTITGTLVGNQFDLGTNVPEIYQVPELANSWTPPMRMIGAGPITSFREVSWRELGVR